MLLSRDFYNICNNFLIILIKKLKKKKRVVAFNIKDINFNYDKTCVKRLIIDDVSVCLIGEFRNRRITQTDRSR